MKAYTSDYQTKALRKLGFPRYSRNNQFPGYTVQELIGFTEPIELRINYYKGLFSVMYFDRVSHRTVKSVEKYLVDALYELLLKSV